MVNAAISRRQKVVQAASLWNSVLRDRQASVDLFARRQDYRQAACTTCQDGNNESKSHLSQGTAIDRRVKSLPVRFFPRWIEILPVFLVTLLQLPAWQLKSVAIDTQYR